MEAAKPANEVMAQASEKLGAGSLLRQKFSTLSPAARAIWAKSGSESGHSLLAHMLDVAAVAEMLLEGEPDSTCKWAEAEFGLPYEQLTRWVAALAGLHDFGKAVPGFQAKWEAGMQAGVHSGLRFPHSACGRDRHDLATAALLGRALHERKVAASGWLRHVTQAVSAHHGYHFLPAEIDLGKPINEPTEWALAREEILRVYWDVLAPEGEPTADGLSLPAVNWLAGLTSCSDWIASNPEWFPLGDRGDDDIRRYHQMACTLASHALRIVGRYEFRGHLDPHTGYSAGFLVSLIIGRSEVEARPLQEVGNRLLSEVDGPALMIVEAPMGEGKTELAFLAHLRLQAVNEHRGFYFALPTQATGNAAFSRAVTFLGNASTGAHDIQLVHAGANMNEEVHHLRGVNNSASESLSSSAWFSHGKRSLLSANGVGTIDQALFAALNVKHHFVRLWGLSNRVIVLDEVHAYDTYTSGLIAALLRWLKALGCSVVLMSATLPKARRNELVSAWGMEPADLPDAAYPRLMLADRSGVRGESFPARPLAPIQLFSVDESLEAIVDLVVDQISKGGCGAVIVNTVNRAQELYLELKRKLEETVPIYLFHARFPADQRAARESEVVDVFGVEGERPERGLMIATQVAEQSLDIDFDFMVTDLAPVDLILQRAGRLHRHAHRKRPLEHIEARLWVSGLQADRLPDIKGTAWGYVYEPYVLLRTWALLRGEGQIQLPGDIDRLVQMVYGDHPLPNDLDEGALAKIEVESYGEYLARIRHQRTLSFNIAIDPAQEPSIAYNGKPRGNEDGDGMGLENKTRLGTDAITLIPVEVVDGGWAIRAGEPAFDPNERIDDDVAIDLYKRHVKVSRKDIVKHFRSKERPRSFEHPLLRNCVPMPVKGGQYIDATLNIRIDAYLGVVYGSSK